MIDADAVKSVDDETSGAPIAITLLQQASTQTTPSCPTPTHQQYHTSSRQHVAPVTHRISIRVVCHRRFNSHAHPVQAGNESISMETATATAIRSQYLPLAP